MTKAKKRLSILDDLKDTSSEVPINDFNLIDLRRLKDEELKEVFKGHNAEDIVPSLFFWVLILLPTIVEIIKSEEVAKAYNSRLNDEFNSGRYTEREIVNFLIEKRNKLREGELIPEVEAKAISSLLIRVIEKHPLFYKFLESKYQYLTEKREHYKIEKKAIKTNEQITSFEFINKPSQSQIKQLFKLFKDEELIGKETELIQFNSIFDGQFIKDQNKIKWLLITNKRTPNISSLIYLFNSLMDGKIIHEKKNPYYGTLSELFCDSKGKNLNKDSFKTSNQHVKRGLSDRTSNKIAEVVEKIKEILP